MLGKYSFRTRVNRLFYAAASAILLSNTVMAVKRDDFKTSDDITFYLRHQEFSRTITPPEQPEGYEALPASPYNVVEDSVRLDGHTLAAVVQHKSVSVPLKVEVHFLKNGTIRVRAQEEEPYVARYDDTQQLVLRDEGHGQEYALAEDLEHTHEIVDGVRVHTVRYTDKKNAAFSVRITENPWTLTYLQNGVPVVELNGKGFFHLEHLRPKPDQETIDNDATGEWKDTFLTWTDYKDRGPESFGMDIRFVGFEHVYGIPEHATSLSLKTTDGSDEDGYTQPYRLWNLGVFEHELDDPLSLYGAIPFMAAHNTAATVGVFWLNASETLVDITREKRKEEGEDSGSVTTHWVSETGVLDLFLMPGPTVSDLYSQYADLVEPTPLPQEFALGYHTCRWSYLDQEDVLTVSDKMHEHDIPYDVIWLDIDYTDGMRYFTWDYSKFPDPMAMQKQLAYDGHKLVTIIDPHVKCDPAYHIWKQGSENGFMIKSITNSNTNKSKPPADYKAWCWPKESNWVDFLNPDAVSWYGEQYQFDKYPDSTKDLFIWNDMNEPIAFRMPESTVEKAATHHGGWEHRDVHNLYGMLNHKATFQGLRARESPAKRPFVLSRSFFAGSQRYGAIWTGDNTASWGHLRASIPMVLSNNIAGMHFSGADVGGFFGDPEPELLVRWYQLSIWYPFFRAHSHRYAKRREPWLFDEPYFSLIRNSVRERYRMLPYWYTLFREASLTGMPIVRPMWMEFPADQGLFAEEKVFMVGPSIMVAPAMDPDLTKPVSVRFPSHENWYNMHTHEAYLGPSRRQFVVDLAQTLVYVRGGSIVPTRERQRKSSAFMKHDPFTLYVYVGHDGTAAGRLYVDDGKSYSYENGSFIERDFSFTSGSLVSRPSARTVDSAQQREYLEQMSDVLVESVVFVGVQARRVSSATITVNGNSTSNLPLDYGKRRTDTKFTIHDLSVLVGSDWEITLC
ncbi:glucosidase II [Coemansia sp. RSA 1804]|nr:glucosidase II [Coemansia sp. RSA 1804]